MNLKEKILLVRAFYYRTFSDPITDTYYIEDNPYPVDGYSFEIGFDNCLIILFALGVVFRFLSYFMLKLLVRKIG
jgi:hypothetical protein